MNREERGQCVDCGRVLLVEFNEKGLIVWMGHQAPVCDGFKRRAEAAGGEREGLMLHVPGEKA